MGFLIPLLAQLPFIRKRRQANKLKDPLGAVLSYFVYVTALLLSLFAIFFYQTSVRELPWTLKSFDYESAFQSRLLALRQNHLEHKESEIPRHGNLTNEEFQGLYDGVWPVIIPGGVAHWPAFVKWTRDLFRGRYGRDYVTVTVYDRGIMEGVNWSMDEFLRQIDVSSSNQWTYLQDEHFLRHHEELLRDIMPMPSLLSLDLLPLLPAKVRPWSALFLWGSAYSRSPLHVDPLNWTGISALLHGKKRWRLFPPGQDDILQATNVLRTRVPLNSVKYQSSIDAFGEYFQKNIRANFVEVEQYPGDVLIIPGGWFHQAFNEEPTLAISTQMVTPKTATTFIEELCRGGDLNRSLPVWFSYMSTERKMKLVGQRLDVDQNQTEFYFI